MFKKLVQKLWGGANEVSTFDVSQFEDPIAEQTDWTPLIRGFVKTRSYKLVKINSNRLEFRATLGFKLFFFFMFFFVMLVPSFTVFFYTSMGVPLYVGMIFIVIMLPFLIFMGFLFSRWTTPIVFDKEKGAFWEGRKEPGQVYDKKELKHLTELEEIHALQLISVYCPGNILYHYPYYYYELNFVLKNSKRINVIGLGKKSQLKKDAGTISLFLNKPVWDATD